jgi:glycine hydroxymethyltransferase
MMLLIASKLCAFKEAMAMSPSLPAEYHGKRRRLADELPKEVLRLVSGRNRQSFELVDVRPKGLNGKVAESLLERLI